jgi:hypothetical protein
LSPSPARERGSAPLESVFAMAILMLLALGVVEVAFALYGRNVVAASAHEGARAALEQGRGAEDAVAVATRTVRGAAGGLVRDLDVAAAVRRSGARSIVTVRVSGLLSSIGPVPLPMPVSVTATSSKEAAP